MSRPVGSAEELERRRRLAVRRVLEDGYSAAAVGRFLGVPGRTVQGWVRAVETAGPAALAARKPPPRPGRLRPEQEQAMLAWLAGPATAQGFANELWTAPRVAKLLRERFQVFYHPRSLNRYLKVRRITPQLPPQVPRERKPEVIQAWTQGRWEEVKKKVQTQRAWLILLDEAGALLSPLVRRSLAPMGHPLVLKIKARHRDKVSMIGALCVSPDGTEIQFHYQTLVNAYYNNVKVAGFLETLLARFPGENLVTVWDGGSMHKGTPIRDLLVREPRLWVERLPPYAPELMPTEGVWCWTKYQQLVNFVPAHLTELHQAIEAVLAEVAAAPTAALLRFFGHDTLPLDIRRLAG